MELNGIAELEESRRSITDPSMGGSYRSQQHNINPFNNFQGNKRNALELSFDIHGNTLQWLKLIKINYRVYQIREKQSTHESI